MKILIDVDELQKEGVLSEALAGTLREHASRATGSTAINVLLALGSFAIMGGFIGILESAIYCALFGVGFILLGWLINRAYAKQWDKLASIWMIVGALLVAGAMDDIIKEPIIAPVVAAAILAAVSVMAESALLVAFATLALATAIGGGMHYWHAVYVVEIKEPTITVVVFSLLAWGAWKDSMQSKKLYERLRIVFARMCVILVNVGFWVGSLWGDTPGHSWNEEQYSYGHHVASAFAGPMISKDMFAIAWAVALIAAGMWGAKQGRRFMVNTVAVFASIEFYTQWFEHMGLQPYSFMISGLIAIGIGLGFWRYNRAALA